MALEFGAGAPHLAEQKEKVLGLRVAWQPGN